MTRPIALLLLTLVFSGSTLGAENWNLDAEQWCTYDETSFSGCYVRIEAQLLSGLAGHVERYGRRLVFYVNGKEVFDRVDSPDDCEGFTCADGSANVSYRLYAHFPSINKYLLLVGYWEGRSYHLVDATTGDKTLLPNLPAIANAGRHFATFTDQSDSSEECMVGAVRIYEVTRDSVTLTATINAQFPVCALLMADGKGGFILYEREYLPDRNIWTKGHPFADVVREKDVWILRKRMEPNQPLHPDAFPRPDGRGRRG